MKANKQNKIKIRRTWGEMKPVTKVKDSKKVYSRKTKFSNENLFD